MPPVKISYVVSFSSQDENFKAVNLVSSDGFKKWLSNPKEKSTEICVTLQLERECTISFIDIGTHWCANIEILVGRSDWPQGRDYESLSPTCIMMTPMDCNLGRNFACTRMFSAKDFNATVASKSWDRLKIICRQPLKKDVQFGLSFLRVKTTDMFTTQKDMHSVANGDVQKSVKSIQKHFFGKTKKVDSPKDEVKAKLLKLAGSAENGTEDEGGLTRTAKLVLAAKKGGTSRPSESTPNKSAFYSDTVTQKYSPAFNEEVQIFLGSLEIKEDELDKVTIADLRHKLERKKKRKLDKDERKLFAELARNYICALFGESDDEKKENDSRGSVRVNVKGETTHVRNNHSTVQESHVDKKCTNFKVKKDQNSGVKYNKSNMGDKNCAKSSFTKVKNDQIRSTKDMERNIDNNAKSPTIEEQLRSVRENANKLFREKQKTSNGGTEAEKSEQENKQFVGRKNAEDDMYKSMTYLERKAFALTNPYKLNKHVNSLKFGPDFSEPSDDKTDITSTNNKWLSKVNPSRNDVMFSPPTRGKRKRESSGSGRGKGANNSMKKDETMSRTPKRGRGRPSATSKEITPTSFERCSVCKESFLPWQLEEHKLTCGSPPSRWEVGGASTSSSPSSDIIEVGVSGPSAVESLRTPEYVECPICSSFFSSDVIQFHASVCGDTVF